MAISPPSDIVLDVAKAADPLQYSAAVERLARLGGSDPTAAAGFDALFSDVGMAPADAAANPFRADLRDRLPGMATATRELPPKPYRQFEAFVLQNFVQEMLPKDATHVFGSGLAGNYWSSMLAEQIANQIAEAGGVGIAASIEAKHPAPADPPGAPLAEHRAALPTRGPASGPFVAFSTLPGLVTGLERNLVDGLSFDDGSSSPSEEI